MWCPQVLAAIIEKCRDPFSYLGLGGMYEQDAAGLSPLMHAVLSGKLSTFELIYEKVKSSGTDKQNKKGETVADLAVQAGNKQVLVLLLNKLLNKDNATIAAAALCGQPKRKQPRQRA